MDSVISIGLRGVQGGLENAAKNADRVTKAFSPDSTGDPIDPLIGLKLDELQVVASTRVIKTGEKLIGSILDILG